MQADSSEVYRTQIQLWQLVYGVHDREDDEQRTRQVVKLALSMRHSNVSKIMDTSQGRKAGDRFEHS